MIVTLFNLFNLEKICVTPYYEADTFGGYSSLTKSLSCEINVTGTATVHSADVFMELHDILKNNKNPSNFSINMTSDIDFWNTNFTIPIGMIDDGKCKSYNGIFDGNGYCIKNIKMKNNDNNKSSSMLCELMNGKIQNINIDGTCEFEGTTASSLILKASGNVIIENVTNKANIHGIKRASGFVNEVSNDKGSTIHMKNCVNHGNVSSANYSCGLINNEMNNNIIIENCMNRGKIEGNEAYGMCLSVSEANNVISLGEVIGREEMYSLWKTSRNKNNTRSVYGMNGICINCEEEVIICKKKNRGIITTNDNNEVRVDLMMNEESGKREYGMYWSYDFSELRPKHVISIAMKQEKKSVTIEVEDGMLIRDIDELKPFFD